MHQCGLPKEMAIELFQPFVIHRLIRQNIVNNIKAAKKLIQRADDEVMQVLQEVIEGHAEVRAVFSVGRRNKIAGLYVTDGKITRNSLIRVTRDGEIMADGKIASLKRFKDDVREVLTGYECGIGVENFTDFNEGDLVESYSFE